MRLAIIGMQWGDEGKGKIVDFLSDKFDAVVRFQGGHNAGHTIEANGKVYKLSLLPSGIVRSKFCVIGSGVVVDPLALKSEIANVEKFGIKVDPSNLVIADNASLILSIHRDLDKLLEDAKGDKKIGTTCRGIGPAYEDQIGRRAIRIFDLTNDDLLKERLSDLLFYHNILRSGLGAPAKTLSEMLDEIAPFREFLLSFAKSSFEISERLESLKNVMFEGAQGSLLDVTYGTFPFVTSSNTIAAQVSIGASVSSSFLQETLGIVKAYTTRVGSGFFPTELHDEMGEFLMTEGREFGTVTGRKRRCGWFDCALIKQPIKLSSVKKIALTKLDVLDKLKKIKICTGYKLDGKLYDHLPLNPSLWPNLVPVYEELDGWCESTASARSVDDLPENAKKYIKRIESVCEVSADIISTGASRDSTIQKFI